MKLTDFFSSSCRVVDCLVCREQALTLSVLAATYQERLEGFEVFGIIKETGVDDEGLVDFNKTYFPYPLYCDKSYAFYHALGDRKVGIHLIWNPLTVFSILCETFQRIRNKKIDGTMKGEGLVQGGIIFFGKDGKPKYVYEEDTGSDLPVADIVTVLDSMRREQDS
jgi:hypothetical protein